MTVYLFVIAAVISILTVVSVVKMSITTVLTDPKQIQVIQGKLLIGIALSKVIPFALLIWGVVQGLSITDTSELYPPIALIIIALGVGVFYITSQKSLAKNEEATFAVNTLITIARPLLFSIPLMAIIILLLLAK